jgi:hypothetical protein
MTKRSRRARRSTSRRNYTRPTSPSRNYTAPVIKPPDSEEAAPDFGEYRYVISDLKRVGILAASMFALLVALSFFIR